MAGFISIRGLKKAFGDFTVLHGIDLDIGEGEVVCVIGPSGSGKSTLIRCINYLEAFDPQSSVRVDGIQVGPGAALAKVRAEVGMVFQSFNLFPHMTVLRNVMLAPMRVRGTRPQEAERKARELLARVGISEQAEKFPGQLSGGQQQRVAIARALAIRPQVLLLDEPLSVLDAQIRRSMLDELAKLHRDLPNLTVLYVTHDQTEALTLANHIGIMRGGRLKAFGSAQSLFRHPPNRFAAEFLGRANLIPVTGLDGADGARAGVKFGVQALSAQNHHRLAKGSDCLLCVRPHDFKLHRGENDTNSLTGVVQSVQWQGDVHNITFEVAEQVLRMTSAPMSNPPEPGASITVHFNPADVTLVPEDKVDG